MNSEHECKKVLLLVESTFRAADHVEGIVPLFCISLTEEPDCFIVAPGDFSIVSAESGELDYAP